MERLDSWQLVKQATYVSIDLNGNALAVFFYKDHSRTLVPGSLMRLASRHGITRFCHNWGYTNEGKLREIVEPHASHTKLVN